MGLLIKSVIQMFLDVSQLLLFVFIFLIGFTLVFVVGAGGQIDDFGSISESMKTMFDAGILGDFDFDSLDGDLVDSNRSVILRILYTFWLIFSVIVLLNFIIAVMGKSYEDVNDVVETQIAYYRMKVTRSRDTSLPALPPPLHTIVLLLKWIYLCLFEPFIYIIFGKILDEERFLGNVFEERDPDRDSTRIGGKHVWRKPYLVQFSENILVSDEPNICNRLTYTHFSHIWKEMWCGGLPRSYVDTKNDKKCCNCSIGHQRTNPDYKVVFVL